MWHVRETLQSNAVWQKKKVFTPLWCREITWAIINDGQNFFSRCLLPNDFKWRTPPKIPVSLLGDLIGDLHFGRLVVQGNFPPEWAEKQTLPPAVTNLQTQQPKPLHRGQRERQHPSAPGVVSMERR